MLDLLISHPAVCKQCGRAVECIRVRFWDDSFAGLLCWDDLRRVVDEHSKDPECRKKFANARALVRDVEAARTGADRTQGRTDGGTGNPPVCDGHPPCASWPPTLDSHRGSVLLCIRRVARLMKAHPEHRDEFRVEMVALLRDALVLDPDDILDRLLDAGRTDQPAPAP